jgi:hypothetical protein
MRGVVQLPRTEEVPPPRNGRTGVRWYIQSIDAGHIQSIVIAPNR